MGCYHTQQASYRIQITDTLLAYEVASCISFESCSASLAARAPKPRAFPSLPASVGGLYRAGSRKSRGGWPDMVRKSLIELSRRGRPPGPGPMPPSSSLYLVRTTHRSHE
jgi:hypothetical protein